MAPDDNDFRYLAQRAACVPSFFFCSFKHTTRVSYIFVATRNNAGDVAARFRGGTRAFAEVSPYSVIPPNSLEFSPSYFVALFFIRLFVFVPLGRRVSAARFITSLSFSLSSRAPLPFSPIARIYVRSRRELYDLAARMHLAVIHVSRSLARKSRPIAINRARRVDTNDRTSPYPLPPPPPLLSRRRESIADFSQERESKCQ